jgi:glutamate synthase domain-containing protein 3
MTLTTLPPILRAEDLFDSLKPEEKQPEDLRIKVEKSERLEQIVRDFEEVLKVVHQPNKFYEDESNKIIKLIKIKSTANEISEFLILLNNYQDDINYQFCSGHYLSALINKSKEKEILINTRHLEKIPDAIGYKNNGKIIHFDGFAGHNLGKSMINGEIYANNAGDSLGSNMQGGKIYVQNAGNSVGIFMKGGIIFAESIGGHVGFMAHGGEIYIKNKYKSLEENFPGGNIYHRGKLIVKNGEKLI